MINHTDNELSVAEQALLGWEEQEICRINNVAGIIEVDRVTENEIQCVFDGWKRGTRQIFRLIGYYSFITEKFTWE